MSEPVAGGMRLEGAARAGRCGGWFRAVTPEGRRRGVLLLDPALTGDPAAFDRAAATVAAVRALGASGVLRMADLLAYDGRAWLVTEQPAEPTAAQLLAAGRLDAAGAALLGYDTAQTLDRLHRSGLAHGGLGPDTVVITASGTAALIEVGLAAALTGVAPDPATDVVAWAELLRALAAAAPAAAAADLLTAVATIAESAGLAAARRAMADGSQQLPGFPDRERLAAARNAVELTAAAAAPAAAAPVAAMPADAAPVAAAPITPPADPNDVSTQVGRRAAAAGGPARPAMRSGAAGAPAAPVRLRFGHGVPVAAAQRWRAGATGQRRRRRRWLQGILSGLITVAVVGGVLGVLAWRQRQTLAVTAVAVAPAQPVTPACDITVDLVGTVRTNGGAGVFTYQWIRSDGQTTAVLAQSVPSGVDVVQVHLYWSFSGQGSLTVSATLRIVAPSPVQATGEFSYTCA